LCFSTWNDIGQYVDIYTPSIRVPKSYICCTEFRNAQFNAQESPADWDYNELMKDMRMITAPKELVQLLEPLELK
jgi:hypothetical protein